MARKLKKLENETHTLYDLEYSEKLKNVENETQTLFDLEYVEKPEKCKKLEMHTVGPGIW
jgi:hypothetical protein